MECGVQSVECRVWRAKCGSKVWSVKCGVWSVMDKVWSGKWGV